MAKRQTKKSYRVEYYHEDRPKTPQHEVVEATSLKTLDNAFFSNHSKHCKIVKRECLR